jgi:hypothetical protein
MRDQEVGRPLLLRAGVGIFFLGFRKITSHNVGKKPRPQLLCTKKNFSAELTER